MKINPRAFVGKRLNLLWDISQFQRLCATLGCREHGQLEVEIDIGVDADGQLVLEGRARTELRTTCQRCLEGMNLPIDSALHWGLLDDDAAAGRLTDALEPVSLEKGVLDLARCLEDQLLLALPLIAKHPLSECSRGEFYSSASAPESPRPTGKHYPFRALGQDPA